SAVQAVCALSGPTDFLQMDAHAVKDARLKHDLPMSPESRLIGGPIQENKDKVARANPVTFVTAKLPPFLLIHGDQDPLVPPHQPRFYGMPSHAAHRPGYFYSLHRRHRDTYPPGANGPRSSASGMLTMMEHSGTHIDALCHQACGLKLFGNLETDAVETTAGF